MNTTKHVIEKKQWMRIGEQMGWFGKFAAKIDKMDDEVLALWVKNYAPLAELASQSVPADKIVDLSSSLFLKFVRDNREAIAQKIEQYISQQEAV